MNNCECKPMNPRCKEVGGLTIVVIPTQSGSSAEGELYAPKIGDYKNAIVKYMADGLVYAYDNDGNWTLIADYNAVTPTVDQELNTASFNPIANRPVALAINELETEINGLATVATTGDYDDLINKPVIDTELDENSTNAVTNSAVATAIDNIIAEIDTPVVYDLEMTSDANNVTFTEDKIDVVTGETTQETDTIPSASETTAGTISASEYTSIKNSQDRLDALEGGSVAISGLSASPSQQDLTDAWLNETGESALINRASIYDITNDKIWTYYDNTSTWYGVSAGGVSVVPFTNSVAGTILGSSTDGNVSANLDGTGTVSGWSTLVSTVGGKADSSSLASVATSGLFSDLSGTVTTSQIDGGAVTAAKIDWTSVIDKIYPVGSIYMSTANVSPATFMGGTWTQIQDRFLLSAGSTYTAGNTGGEATHTLTVQEMPSHTHSWNGYASLDTDAGDARRQAINTQRYNQDPTQSGTINNTGGGQAHNNMPPYLVVYMWKRTA